MRQSTTDRMNDYDADSCAVGDGGYCFSGAAILVRGWGSAESDRQADLCLRMALSAAQYEERLRLLDIANGYRASAVRMEACEPSGPVNILSPTPQMALFSRRF